MKRNSTLLRPRSRRQREYYYFKMKRGENASVESICAETNCTTNLNERGIPPISCDVCGYLFCTKCMRTTKRNCELISGYKDIKMVCNGCLAFTFTSR